ncbi:MAG TPA: hypothetical protein VGR13_07605 [Actinomycetota bacterium]|nr:hypothetical protein [Actinomycetota bacterium]
MAQVMQRLGFRGADGEPIEPSEERVRFALFEKEIEKDSLPAPKAKIQLNGGVGYVVGWHLDPVGKKTRSGYAATAIVKLTEVDYDVLPPDPTLFGEGGDENSEEAGPED